MGYYSDQDIRKALNKDIVIEPFFEDALTPIGYDFRIGDYVFSLEKGIIEPENGVYILPPQSTIQILTEESLWVSGRIAGTFHSKVSLVSKGLSHISTTLDPNWYGPLLITTRNNMDRAIEIKADQQFVTLMFAEVKTPTASKHKKPEFRKDILIKQLDQQEESYIKKISLVLMDSEASESFRQKVKKANEPMFSKILFSERKKFAIRYLKFAYNLSFYIAFLALIFLPTYWDHIKQYFHNINYDSKVFTVQVTALISLIALKVSLNKRDT